MGLIGSLWPSAPGARCQRTDPYLSRPATTVREHLDRQPYRGRCECGRLAFDRDRSAVLLGDDVIADREAEPGALPPVGLVVKNGGADRHLCGALVRVGEHRG